MRLIFVIWMAIILLAGCSSKDSNDIVVTGEIDELVLIQNNGCFDNLGVIDATAYVFNRTNINSDNFFEIDDIDGIPPEPYETIFITKKTGNSYIYNVTFKDEGLYSIGVICNPNRDDPAVDDRISFIQKASIRIGTINDITVETIIPTSHINASNECLNCHTLGPSYDFAVVNHNYVIGLCADSGCHDKSL